jgi:hypothetical protein
MYREGVLPSGDPMPASVNRDIPAYGAMLTCVSCHLRSGIGSVEGGVAARPVSGPRLYQPLFRSPKELRRRKPRSPRSSAEPDLVRPAYTDATLARAIREGIDPTGRMLDGVMPRYVLDDRDMAILVGYLKDLSTERSPGVTDTTLRFATVVTEGVPPADRDAMLATLEAYVADRNAQPRRRQPPTPGGATFLEPMYAGYAGPRRLELVRWELGGAPETWRRQLDALYSAQPVFGLVGGMAAGEWRPIHEFSEDQGVPSLFPITQLPVVSGTDWQTLYLSKGLYQEGETAARYLLSKPDRAAGTPVVEVLRETPEGRALSKGFEETWRTLGRPEPVRRMLGPEERLTAAALQAAAGAGEAGVAVLWLGAGDMSALEELITAPRRPRMLLVSSGLLGGALESIPERARSLTYITYPGPLPEEQQRRMPAVESWLRARGIALSRPAVQSRAYFIGWMLTSALARMRDDFYRDYLLDIMDMMSDQTYTIVAHERVSFGPSQRYASKGCYVVQLGTGPRPELTKRSEWVVR